MTRSRLPRPHPVRLPGVPRRRLRAGHYSDVYFKNAARVLEAMTRAGEEHAGIAPALREGRPPRRFRPGDAVVEMQIFARRRPRYVAAGINLALGLLRDGIDRGSPGRPPALSVRAVPEGTLTRPLDPVLVVRGLYRRFAHLETPILGVLTRASRIATGVYEACRAARGKPVLFFPARFDLPQTQAVDGYACDVAHATWGRIAGRRAEPLLSTPAQGTLGRGHAGGTVPHAYVLCHLGDTAAAMEAFCRHMPPAVPRVALVDTTNDCVGEAVRTARRMFAAYMRRLEAGQAASARRFVLAGVRADTAADLRDRSVPRAADPRLERGVTPVLARLLRRALDEQPAALGLRGRRRRIAERYFRAIRIVATGGFDAAKIRFFETRRAPVDIYGVGSAFLRGPANDYTADVVRVRAGGRFRVTAKTGRAPRPNPDLVRVRL